MRLKELADLTETQPPNLTRYFKNRPENEVSKIGNRVHGIRPRGVEAFLRKHGFEKIYKPGVYYTNSQCGGIGKTTTTISMAYSFSRLSNREDFPIVIADVDGQASTTLQLLGWKNRRQGATGKNKRHPVLIDYVDGRVNTISELLVPIGNNIWLIPSSLENAYLEKAVGTPKQVKALGKQVILDIFDELSDNGRLKIFFDGPPALSPVTHSFLHGINTLPDDCDKVLCLPIRADDFGVNGCEIALGEFEDMLSTFNVERKTNVVPFLTFYDRRTTNSAEAMERAVKSEVIQKYGLSQIVIRESAELPKKLLQNTHIYSDKGYKSHPVGQDYQDLVLSIMGWSKP